MGFFQKIGHAFSSAGRSVGGLFSKGAHEVGSAFRKGGHVIARGLGGMAGGSLGAEIGGGIASVFGPEAIPVGMAVGGLIGRTAGAEGAGRIETTTRGIASGKRPILGGQLRRSDSPPRMAMPPVQPPKLPGPAPRKPMVGRDGGGIYRGPPLDGNLLEKTKPKPKRNFV